MLLQNKKTDLPFFIISAIYGFLIWLLAPYINGCIEPWDCNVQIYIAELIIWGMIFGLIKNHSRFVIYIGTVVGQIIYLAIQPAGNLKILGMGLLFILCLAVTAGDVVTSVIRYLVKG